MEKWIEGYEGRYSIDCRGNVYSHRPSGKKPIAIKNDKAGYCRVGLSKGGDLRNMLVHRIVASEFIGKSDLTVNHKDGDKKNNTLENLHFCSQAENNRHAFDTGLKKGRKGSSHHFAKLTEGDVKIIRMTYEGFGSGPLMTQRQMASIFNVSFQTISDVINKKLWSHV